MDKKSLSDEEAAAIGDAIQKALETVAERIKVLYDKELSRLRAENAALKSALESNAKILKTQVEDSQENEKRLRAELDAEKESNRNNVAKQFESPGAVETERILADLKETAEYWEKEKSDNVELRAEFDLERESNRNNVACYEQQIREFRAELEQTSKLLNAARKEVSEVRAELEQAKSRECKDTCESWRLKGLYENAKAELEQAKNDAWNREQAIKAQDMDLELTRAQLPDGMKHCRILFKRCEKGHSWLTAENWIEFPCLVCELEQARRDRDALLLQNEGKTLKLRMDMIARAEQAESSLAKVTKERDDLMAERNQIL